MSEAIRDGVGNNTLAEVYVDNKLATRAVSSTETQDAVIEDRAWNINTGWISTISADSALLYYNNQDEADFFIDSIAVGLKESAATEVQGVYLVVQPTAGTLITAATDCDMIENRRVGSGAAFDAATKVYKATASGQTLTGGRDAALFAQSDGGRLYATVDFVVPKGQAIGLRIEVLGGFSDDVYAALIGYQRKTL